MFYGTSVYIILKLKLKNILICIILFFYFTLLLTLYNKVSFVNIS